MVTPVNEHKIILVILADRLTETLTMQIETVTRKPSVILDVVDFMDEVINDYINLETAVLAILTKTSRLSPLQVECECQMLKSKRDALQNKDNQLLEILKLGGSEIVNHKLLDDYRVASSDVAKACDLLREELEYLQLKVPDSHLP